MERDATAKFAYPQKFFRPLSGKRPKALGADLRSRKIRAPCHPAPRKNGRRARRRRIRDARPRALAQLHTLDRETFGRRLRSARKRFGWTLAEAAERSGVSITTISRAERGQLALSYEKFSALGRALRMDMGALFAEAGREAQAFEGPILTRAGRGVTYRGSSFSYEFLATQVAGSR
jgi:transcriptional regulator with XRE-family HTH domain